MGDGMERDVRLLGIIPVGNMGGELLLEAMNGIHDAFSAAMQYPDDAVFFQCAQVVDRPMNIPKTAYNSEKGLHSIEPFFGLSREVKEIIDRTLVQQGRRKLYKSLVLTDVPLYSNVFNISVYGEADVNGSHAVVSTGLLKRGARQTTLKERTIKECVHELGHTMGLRHCSTSTCVMSLSSDLYDVDGKSRHFCPACAGALSFDAVW